MTDQEKIKMFNRAVKFQMDGLIFLTMKSRKNGKCSWVIEDITTGKILNSNMEWEEDLPLKKRDESFELRTRFDLETAKVVYEQFKAFAI